MNKINTKAPYFIYYTEPLLDSVVVNLYIYSGKESNFFSGTGVEAVRLFSSAINDEVTFEVSDIIDGYIDDKFNGDYKSNNLWIRYSLTSTTTTSSGFSSEQSVLTNLMAYDGFPYATDGANAQLSSVVMQSNNTIIANDYDAINIPIDANNHDVTITYYNKGDVQYTETLTSSDESDEIIQYSTNSIGDYKKFKSRVELDGGVVEAKSCLEASYQDFYSVVDTDYIEVSYNGLKESITVKEIEECKYTPYKVVFKNKFGAWQDLWFFKRSDLSLSTKSETYKSNVIKQGGYSISEHQDRIYSKNGKEKLKLNTGFYPESYNEVFTQLSLSQQVYIDYNEQILPINVKTSSMKFKNNVNDKLINYSIEVEFSFDKINSRR